MVGWAGCRPNDRVGGIRPNGRAGGMQTQWSGGRDADPMVGWAGCSGWDAVGGLRWLGCGERVGWSDGMGECGGRMRRVNVAGECVADCACLLIGVAGVAGGARRTADSAAKRALLVIAVSRPTAALRQASGARRSYFDGVKEGLQQTRRVVLEAPAVDGDELAALHTERPPQPSLPAHGAAIRCHASKCDGRL